MSIRLTDEEIISIQGTGDMCQDPPNATWDYVGLGDFRAIAEAQRKKIIRWLKKGSMDAHITILQVSTKEWQALRTRSGMVSNG